MKSKRAEGYIDDNIYDAGDLVDKDGCGMAVVMERDAIRGVELAEEDMIEKAVKAFAEACEMYAGNERCLECVKCRDCERVKQFRQRLDKR